MTMSVFYRRRKSSWQTAGKEAGAPEELTLREVRENRPALNILRQEDSSVSVTGKDAEVPGHSDDSNSAARI